MRFLNKEQYSGAGETFKYFSLENRCYRFQNYITEMNLTKKGQQKAALQSLANMLFCSLPLQTIGDQSADGPANHVLS